MGTILETMKGSGDACYNVAEEHLFMTGEAPNHSPTNVDLFREKVIATRRKTGRLQKELADVLGIDAQVLSRNLHGVKQAFLTHVEVKQIIKALADWEAISTQGEAIELLTLMGLKAESFSVEEWNTIPLNRLEQAPHNIISGVTSPVPLQFNGPPLPVPSTSLIGREYH